MCPLFVTAVVSIVNVDFDPGVTLDRLVRLTGVGKVTPRFLGGTVLVSSRPSAGGSDGGI